MDKYNLLPGEWKDPREEKLFPMSDVRGESGAMDKLATRPRSDHQVAASRTNGALSQGPVSATGKSMSSLSSVRTGVSAKRVVLQGESVEDHQRQLDAWIDTFQPTTQGEAFLVARVSDALMRLDRLDIQGQKVQEAGVEQELKKSEGYQEFLNKKNTREAVASLAETCEGISSFVPFEQVQQLAPGMKKVLQLAEDVDVPMKFLVAMRDAVNGVLVDAIIGVEPEAFHDVAVVATDVITWLDVNVAALRGGLDLARQELAHNPALGDECQLQLLDRYRGRIMREVDGVLRLLKQVRELAPCDVDPGSLVHVEMRVLGRPLSPR
jgi:hypothetical protein